MDHQLDPTTTAADSLEVPPLPPPPADMINLNNEELPTPQEAVALTPTAFDFQDDQISTAEIVVSDKPAGFQNDEQVDDPPSSKLDVVSQYDFTKSIQKCSSCGVEKATIICSNCRPLDQQTNIAMENESENKCVAYSLNGENQAEKTDLSIEIDHNKTQPGSCSSGLRNKISVESLIKNGNMLYCQDCFLVVHQAIKNTHMPIDLKSSKSNAATSIDTSSIQIAPISTAEQEPKTPAPVIFDNNTIEQSIVKADEEQRRLDKEKMKSGLEELTRELEMLKRRQLEFNGVKTSIRHMNETIKEDLMLDFASVADQMKNKLDDITNTIKTKLKDAYSVIRDMHDKIPGRLEEINTNMRELEQIVLNDDHIYSLEEMQTNYARKSQEVVELINQLNADLRLVCEHYKSTGNTSAISSASQSPVMDVNHNNLFMHTLNSTTSPPSMCLFVEDRLYPQINYLVDLTQLKDVVDNICVQINSPEANKSRHELMSKYSQIELVPGIRLFCTVTTGLSNDGSFWIHIIGEARVDQTNANSNETGVEELPPDVYDPVFQQKLLIQYGKERIKSNMFLEEINKTIRRLRIGRRELKTFSEISEDESGRNVAVYPRLNQKCFCYDHRSQKWLRARVTSLDPVRKECQVKYLDTGANDEGRLPGFDSMIDADLVSQYDDQVQRMPYRSLKCFLHKSHQHLFPSPVLESAVPSLPDCASTPLLPNGLHNLNPLNQDTTDKYERNISLDTRYIFKDITHNKNLMCELVEKVDNDPERDVESWAIKLTYVDAESSGSSSSGSSSVKRGSIDSINKHIISHNTAVSRKQAENQIPFSCTDIRFAQGQLPSSNITKVLEKSNDEAQSEIKSEIQVPSVASPLGKPARSQVVLNDKTGFFQTDETRLCTDREGSCVLYSQLSRFGTFWMRPLNCALGDDVSVIKSISQKIDTVMNRSGTEGYQSFSQLRKTPKTGELCVIRLRPSTLGGRSNNNNNRWEWHRGLIENIDTKRERCSVRQLDRGSYKETYWSDTYPLTESLRDDLVTADPNMNKYLSIRCTLFKQKLRLRDSKVLDEFDKLTTHPAKGKMNVLRFKLVEHILTPDSGSVFSHWYTHLYNPNSNINQDCSINQIIYQMLPRSDKFGATEPNTFDNIPKTEEEEWVVKHATPSLPVAPSPELAALAKSNLRPISSLDNIKLLVASVVATNEQQKTPSDSEETKKEMRKSRSCNSIKDCPILADSTEKPESPLQSKSLSTDNNQAGQLCFRCFQRGHHQKQCTQSNLAIQKCHNCQQPGHLAKKCPNSKKDSPSIQSTAVPATSETTPQHTPQTSQKDDNKIVSRKNSSGSNRPNQRGGCKPDTDSHKGDHHRRRDDDHHSPCRRFAAAFPDQAQPGSGSGGATGSRSARYSNRRGGGGGGNNRTTNFMSDDELLDDIEVGRGVILSDDNDAVFEDSIEHHVEQVVRSGGLDDQQQQQQTLATRSWLRSFQQEHLADFEEEQREKNRRLISDLESEENLNDIVGSLTNGQAYNNGNNGANGLDVTQPVDNRHALLLESASARHQDDDNRSMISSASSTTSSSNSPESIDSLKKGRQVHSDNDESFASCTDEIQNAPDAPGITPVKPSTISTRTGSANPDGNITNPQTVTTPSNNQTVTTITTNNECSNCGNDKSKMERMKQFKVAIFVESFDDYSFSSSSLTNQNSQSSLREFEHIEMATGLDVNHNDVSLSSSRLLANDDEFMFDSNANYDYIINNRDAKPPLSVSTLPMTSGAGNSNNNSNANRLVSLHNAHSNLSTISECTNETYNDSNHSRDRLLSSNLNHNHIDHHAIPAPLSPSAYALVNSDETTSDAAILGVGGERHVTKRRHRSGSRRDDSTPSSNNALSFEIQGNNADIRQAIHRLIDKARDIQVSLIDENKSSLEIISSSDTNLPPPPPLETFNQSNSLLPSIDVTDKLFAEFSQQQGESILAGGQNNQNNGSNQGSLIRTNNSHMVEELLNETVSLDRSMLNPPAESLPPKTPPARGGRGMFKPAATVPQDSISSTLEISSYTMESMNSNFVVTPLVSQNTNGVNFVSISVSPRRHQQSQLSSSQAPPPGNPLTSLPSPRSISMTLPSPPTFVLNQSVQNQSHQQHHVPAYSSQNFVSPTTAGTLSFNSPLPPPPAPPLPPNDIFREPLEVRAEQTTPNIIPSTGLVSSIKAQLQERKLGTSSADASNKTNMRKEDTDPSFQTGKISLYGLDNEEEQPASPVPLAPPIPDNLFQQAKANLKPVRNNHISSSLSTIGSDSIFMESSEKSSESSVQPSTKTDTVSSQRVKNEPLVKPSAPSPGQLKYDQTSKYQPARFKMMPQLAKLPTSSPKSCPENFIKPTSRGQEENDNDDNDSVYSSMSSRQCLSVTQRAEMPPSEFKLDHLSDINPKRLYESCKFRCRIHDVIDKSGCFGLEVIYPDEDEKKFKQLFKLFRLSSAINKPPARLHRLQRVSAFYRDNWHRAVVLSDSFILDDKYTSIIEVKFVDLGIRRSVNRYEQVREIDDKFFNFPLKSVYCTVNVDEELKKMLAEKNSRRVDSLEKMCLSLEARKFFTRQVYGKLLYAKVIGLREQEPIKLILGAQTKRGIIDVFMYTMSKYDRNRYELIKQLHNKTKDQVFNTISTKTQPAIQKNLEMLLIQQKQQQQQSLKPNSLITPDESLETTLTNECQSEETISLNSDAQVLCSEDGGPRDNIDCCYSENFDEYEEYDDQEEEIYDAFDETDSALFSHLIDYVASKTTQKNDYEYGLDLTPVSEKKSNQSHLDIDSVHLSSRTGPRMVKSIVYSDKSPLRDHQTPVRSNDPNDMHQRSTAQVNSRNRMIRAQQESKQQHQTPLLPPSGRNTQSHLSDTDSSLSQVNCCQIPTGLKHKLMKELSKSKSQTLKEQATVDYNDLSGNRKAVKFLTN